jgi:hypothetical protein
MNPANFPFKAFSSSTLIVMWHWKMPRLLVLKEKVVSSGCPQWTYCMHLYSVETMYLNTSLVAWTCEWNRIVLNVVSHGSPTFLWPMATLVIGYWFMDCTWKYGNKWYTYPPKLLWNFCSIYTMTQPGRSQVGNPWCK